MLLVINVVHHKVSLIYSVIIAVTNLERLVKYANKVSAKDCFCSKCGNKIN